MRCEMKQKPRSIENLGQSIQWVETAPYLGVIADTQLSWAARTI